MEKFHLIAAQIVETKRLKQSGRIRVVLELTENDSRGYYPTLADLEVKEGLLDLEVELRGYQNEPQDNPEVNLHSYDS